MSNMFAALDSDNDDEPVAKVAAKKEAPKSAPKAAEAPKAAPKPKGTFPNREAVPCDGGDWILWIGAMPGLRDSLFAPAKKGVVALDIFR